jgi:hypothetical protein
MLYLLSCIYPLRHCVRVRRTVDSQSVPPWYIQIHLRGGWYTLHCLSAGLLVQELRPEVSSVCVLFSTAYTTIPIKSSFSIL